VACLLAVNDQSDIQLLDQARRGDVAALEQLLKRHQAQVYRFGLKMCRDPDDAQDVLQDTLLAMARGIREFRGSASLSTWLYTVARSFCIKKRRKSQFAPDHIETLDTSVQAVPEAEPASPSQGPDDAFLSRQVESALEQAIAALEPASREVLILRDMEGLTAAEVAEVLGIGVPAVKSRLHRARVAVRARIAPLLGLPNATSLPSTAGCPDVLTLYSQHLEEEISPQLCAEMEHHLDGCPRCRSACDSLKRTLALCRTASNATEVPPSVQASVKKALQSLLENS
jgi:RNA polymerase sigma-70 factor, ECF subfamily